MGLYQKYRDKNGRLYGPWFVKYPVTKDARTGKLKYKAEKVGMSKRLALKALQKKQLEFAEKKFLGFEEKIQIGFDELVDWYLSLASVRQKKSFNKDQERSEALKRFFGQYLAEEIKPSMVEKFIEQRQSEVTRRKTAPKPATINRELALMKRIFNLAIREEKVEKNPCWKVAMLPENNARDRVLSAEEFERLLQELDPVTRAIVQVAYFTGMRQSEILSMTWDKVNLREGFISLESEDTKTKKPRKIFLVRQAIEIFMELSKLRSIGHNYVFIRKNGKLVISIRKVFENACKRASIKNFRFHDLRHCFNTNMRKAGVHQSVIMKLTGHRTPGMFFRYNTVDEEDGREAVAKFEKFLESTEAEKSTLCAPGPQERKKQRPGKASMLLK